VRRAITGAAILVGVFVIAPFVGAALLGFVIVCFARRRGVPGFRMVDTVR
jgi:hypothetical protein